MDPGFGDIGECQGFVRGQGRATHFPWGVLSGKAHGRKGSAPSVMSDTAELSDMTVECVLTFAPANFFAVCNPKPKSTSPLKQDHDATIGTKQM